MQNFHSNKVDRSSLSCSVVFSKFLGRYFVKWKIYLTRIFIEIGSCDLLSLEDFFCFVDLRLNHPRWAKNLKMFQGCLWDVFTTLDIFCASTLLALDVLITSQGLLLDVQDILPTGMSQRQLFTKIR